MGYAVEQRLRLIDFLLEHYGHVGRREVCNYFGISTPCASLDFAKYAELNPGNMQYDWSSKRWVKAETFQTAYP